LRTLTFFPEGRLASKFWSEIAGAGQGDYEEVDDAALESWLARVGDQAKP
jgi:hypothetical protein